METAVVNMNESKANQNNDMKNFKDELEHVMERVEEINEKMYDFEANKRNNLIFYGVPNEQKEIQPALLQKITHIIRTQLGIRRDIPVAKVTGQGCLRDLQTWSLKTSFLAVCRSCCRFHKKHIW